MLFNLQMSLCDAFPSLTPFDVRNQSFQEVMLLVRRMENYNIAKKKDETKKIRRPASDNWF